jgi:hypothetical protein
LEESFEYEQATEPNAQPLKQKNNEEEEQYKR